MRLALDHLKCYAKCPTTTYKEKGTVNGNQFSGHLPIFTRVWKLPNLSSP